MPAVVQLLAVPVLGELVVGGAGHDLAAQLGDRVVVEHRAQGAGRHDVALDLQDLAGGDDLDAELVARLSDRLGVDVGAEDLGPLLVQDTSRGGSRRCRAPGWRPSGP